MNCTQNVFFINNSQKNLNIFLSLYKQSNLFNNLWYLNYIEKQNVSLMYLSEHGILVDKSVYYNKDSIIYSAAKDSIRNKLSHSIISTSRKISHIDYINNQLWSLNRIAYLNTNFYSVKKLLFTNRVVKEPRTLLNKIHKNIGFVNEEADFISY